MSDTTSQDEVGWAVVEHMLLPRRYNIKRYRENSKSHSPQSRELPLLVCSNTMCPTRGTRQCDRDADRPGEGAAAGRGPDPRPPPSPHALRLRRPLQGRRLPVSLRRPRTHSAQGGRPHGHTGEYRGSLLTSHHASFILQIPVKVCIYPADKRKRFGLGRRKQQ